MKHYGDITKINGALVAPVDVITGGSPCQDLSVAGKRAGLAGERSGLFMEQIRLIKEMRAHDRETNSRANEHIRPRYMVWENVPGAFSSNKGEDFRAVLEETAKIADETAVIPRPPKGKWQPAGCIMGDGWSIAWRVHDAQFWGVPQRRKRIALVADFGGQSAPEILFVKQGLSGDFEPGAAEGKEVAGAVGDGIKKASGFNGWKSVSGDIQYQENKCPTIERNMPPNVIVEPLLLESNQNHATIQTDGISTTLPASMGMGGGYVPMVVQGVDVYNGQLTGKVAATITAACGGTNTSGAKVFCLAGNSIDRADTAECNGKGWRENESYTLNTIDRHAVYDARGNGDGNICPTITGDHENRITDYTAVCIGNGQADIASHITIECAQTLNCMHDQQAIMTYAMQRNDQYKQSDKSHTCSARDYKSATDLVVTAVDCRNGTENPYINGTLQAKSTGGIGVNFQNVCRCGTSVRRLTPLECTRLQGYPDGWVDIGEWTDNNGKIHKDADSPKYKALGNSIALPFWQWMAQRIVKYIDHEPTMASLFDGIGGFPLVFSRCGCIPVWASEVEEFSIAVTKSRFPDNEETKN